MGKRLVEIAKENGAEAIYHSCTGKENNQVRFKTCNKSICTRNGHYCALGIWDIKSR